MPATEAQNAAIIDALVTSYNGEIETVASYIANSVNLDGMRAKHIKNSLEEDIQEELGHAQLIAKRIKVLGGLVPGSQALTWTQTMLQPPSETTDVLSVIKGVIAAEEAAIEGYEKVIELAGGVDPATEDLAITILADEQEHRREFLGFLKEFESGAVSDERQQQALARGPGATPTVRVRPGRDGRHFLRVLIAPGAFKESLTADAAAAAMQRGVQNAARRLGAAIFTDLCPVADGGDGFVRALVGATGGELRTDRVTGPLGEPVDAEWGVLSGQAPERADVPVGQVARRAVETALDLPSGALARSPKPLQPWKTAVLEAATCTGLALVPAGQRNPARTTTFGLGELISHALDAGCGRIIVGLGGSATIDGGLGVARALGVRLTDSAGRPLTSPDRPHPVGDDLARLAHLAVNTRDDRLDHVRVTVAADVGIPLLGPGGAARVFGPQKGASPEQIELLESGLATLAARCAQAGLSADPESPGAGAAGGLGFGLSAMLDATIQPGAGLVLEAVRFASRARQADIVLTGEGRLDSTTTSGKLVHAVATAARDAGAMPIALVGALGDGADAAAAAAGIQAYRAITPPGAPAEEAMRFAADLLEAETERTIRAALTSDPR